MKKTLFQQREKGLDPTLGTSLGLCPVTSPTAEVGPIHIAAPRVGPEATPTLPGWLQQTMFYEFVCPIFHVKSILHVLIVHTGAIVEVEAGVDTAEDTLVLEVAPTEVPVGKY